MIKDLIEEEEDFNSQGEENSMFNQFFVKRFDVILKLDAINEIRADNSFSLGFK